MSVKLRFYQRKHILAVVCQSNQSGSCREQSSVILNVSSTTFLRLVTPHYFDFHLQPNANPATTSPSFLPDLNFPFHMKAVANGI